MIEMKYYKSAAVAAAVLCCAVFGYRSYRASVAVVIDPKSLYQVTKVVDGDTFKAEVGTHEITVRVLGINTPETVDPRKPVECFGPEASAEAKSLLTGRSVRLQLNPDREEKDKYGRYLAYAYRDDGLFINMFMLENGFAREYTYGRPYMLQAEFRSAEKTAQDQKKGLWTSCTK